MRTRSLAAAFWIALGCACGGKVEQTGGAAGQATGGATQATGGAAQATGGAGDAGLGGTSGGGGGSTPGSGGTNANPCPPVAPCNWCSGTPTYDANGCVTGWVCANGIDPCAQGPCQNDCPPDQSCAPDGLCWPIPPPPTCSAEQCSGPNYDCTCAWSCSNGNGYGFHCTIDSLKTTCSCLANGSQVDGCSWYNSDGGSPSVCQAVGDGCCAKLPH